MSQVRHSKNLTAPCRDTPDPAFPTARNEKAVFAAPNTTLIGVSISGGVMRHGAGYRSVPWDPGERESSTEGRGGLLEERVEGSRWYKVSECCHPECIFDGADRQPFFAAIIVFSSKLLQTQLALLLRYMEGLLLSPTFSDRRGGAAPLSTIATDQPSQLRKYPPT